MLYIRNDIDLYMTQFDDIIVTPVYGPLSTGNFPGIIPKMNLGVLNGVRPNPPKFYPANGSSEFSNARREYYRTATKLANPYGPIAKNASCGNTLAPSPRIPGFIGCVSVMTPNGRGLCNTTNAYSSNKYIPPQSSSLFTAARKRTAVGKSSYKQGLPDSAPLSYKNYNTNDVKNALRYTRGGGSVAPAKKGSIYNTSTPGKGIYVSSTGTM